MTANLLTTFILLSLYFYIGSICEERRLLVEFGQAYQVYQRQVPRLIPRVRLWRSSKGAKSEHPGFTRRILGASCGRHQAATRQASLRERVTEVNSEAARIGSRQPRI
jgi:hypothetical protein